MTRVLRERAAPRLSVGRVARDPVIVGLVLLGLALRIAYALAFHMEVRGDQEDYVRLGRDLGGWLTSNDAYHTPGYPLIIAINWLVGLGDDAVRSEQALALTAACFAAAITAARIGGLAAGRAAAALALAPPLVTVPSLMLPDSIAASLLAGAVLALGVGWLTEHRLPALALAGSLGSLATLTRPNLSLFLPVVAIVAMVGARRRRMRAAAAIAVAASVLVVIGPWAARNVAQLGRPAPLGDASSSSLIAAAVHLPIDRSAGAFGAWNRSVAYYTNAPRAGAPLTIDEAAATDPWRTLADNLAERPLDQLSAALFWQKEAWLVAFDDHAQYGREPVIPYELSALWQWTLLALAAAGLWLGRREPLIRLIAATVTVLALPFFAILTEPRYAVPLIALLTVPAGLGAASASRFAAGHVARLRASRSRSAAP